MDTTLIKLDSLLNQVTRIASIVSDRSKYLNKGETTKPLFGDLSIFNKYYELTSERRITYSFKHNRTGYTSHFQSVQEYLLNRETKYNSYLFNLLDFNVKLVDNRKYYAGMMSFGGTMWIQINPLSTQKSIFSVVSHELGHAWSMQLPKLVNIGSEKLMMETIKYYLISIGALKETSMINNFIYLRKLIWKHISFYGGKDIWEAFAELFMGAYEDVEMVSGFDKSKAINAIEYFNNRIIKAMYDKW